MRSYFSLLGASTLQLKFVHLFRCFGCLKTKLWDEVLFSSRQGLQHKTLIHDAIDIFVACYTFAHYCLAASVSSVRRSDGGPIVVTVPAGRLRRTSAAATPTPPASPPSAVGLRRCGALLPMTAGPRPTRPLALQHTPPVIPAGITAATAADDGSVRRACCIAALSWRYW